ncbi:M12 family metallo-peptidase [Hymenobacter sp. BT770]|uniref:reprolysin-like metallopeptidase n=1 Tax=Hymenobacter sp. BT770 TaxID=2886942 RepID=UPI001D0FF7E6|nr:M12 family metallo-peptidase [Hymenobacter sp. BT770]MCC3154237.1 M12 family metallo-peptidase [Hymenobacter sp. BT770]MDO3416383.1 M12 family metallo-peptidase [Hymenobacter sp. BT770]
MSRHYRLTFPLLFSLLLLVAGQAHAQKPLALWRPATPAARAAAASPEPASWFTLDAAQLATRLAAAPPETRPTEAVTLELPYPDGTLHRFALTQVPVMAPALAARFPQIRTYAGHAQDDPATTVRLETGPAGLHAQVTGPTGVHSILADPAAANRYESRQDAPVKFDCKALPNPTAQQPLLRTTASAPTAPYGSQLRTMRLALAATGEYTRQLGGGTVAGTVASMVTLVSQLNAVYERDLALRLQLVANTDLLVYLDPATDPFDNSSPVALMNANEAVVNAAVGVSNYDLGHVLGYMSGGYSGIAYVGVVCSTTLAAAGASTGSSAGLMATVLTHEIGHQLGSAHTFNGDQGNCAGGSRSASLAFEPGAGNTIMSYDGRCNPDNVGSAVPYFHAGSISAIMSKLSCGTLTANGNHPPTLTVPPSGYAIPMGTPFSLAGTGTDADGDALTFSWEELDLGNASGLAGAATDATAPPLFRSFAPQASATRTFPALSSILNNTASTGEILPLVARPLNFRLTARDNHSGMATADVSLTVAAAGPFRVTAPSAAISAAGSSTYTVRWDVLGTDLAPVNCANVQILFSTDGGQTFPTVLLSSTPNNGTAQVTFPKTATTQGRIKIQAINNVFFAINSGNITLSGSLPVELTAFSAEARATSAHLAWATASEKNNTGFAVEASADGTVFRRLGWVAGQGNSSSPSQYQFEDGTLAQYGNPTVYYRLRQIDVDGTETFSPVRSVAVPAGLAAQFQVWPNPARAAVSVAGVAPGQVVQLLDLTGRLLLQKTQSTSGPLQLELPSSLAQGIYVVRANGQSRRLVVE